MYYMQRYFVLLFSVIRIANNSPSIIILRMLCMISGREQLWNILTSSVTLKNQNEIDKWKLQDPNFKLVISERIHQLFHL